MDFTSGLPPDFTAQAMSLGQRQAIANALLQQGMGPMQQPQQIGRIASRASPLAAVEKIVSALAGMRAQGGVYQAQQDLSNRYNTMQAQAVQDYMRQRQGGYTPDMPVKMDDEGNALPQPSAAMPDPQGAAMRAISSPFKALNEVGKMDISTMEKNQVTPGDILKLDSYDPQTKIAVAQMMQKGMPLATALSLLAPKMGGAIPGNWKDFLPQGATLDPTDPAGVVRMTGPDKAMDVYQMHFEGGQFKGLTKLDNAPKVTVTAETKFPTEWATQQAKLIGEKAKASHEAATQAAGDLSQLQTAVGAYNQGIKTGSFQEARNAIDRAAETLGFKSADPTISNTDVFMRSMAQRILQHTKDLRPMSDPDRKFLEEILSGRNLDDKGLQRMLEIGVENSIKNVHAHNNWLKEQASKMEGTMPGFIDAYRVSSPLDNPEFRMQIGPTPQPSGTLRPYTGPMPSGQQ